MGKRVFAGDPIIPNVLITDSVQVNVDPGDNINEMEPAVAVGKNGEIYVIWTYMQGHEVLFSRSLDGGSSFETPVRINDDVTYPDTSLMPGWHPASQAEIAVDDKGNIYVVWSDMRSWTSRNWQFPIADIYLDKSMDGGITWQGDVNVSSPSSLTSENYHLYPSIAVKNNNGYVFVSFSDNSRRGQGDQGDIGVARSIDGGATFEEKKSVKDELGPKQDIVSAIAVDQVSYFNNVYVAYSGLTDNGNVGYSDVFVAKSADDGITFPVLTRVNDVVAMDQFEPDISAYANKVAVAWRDLRAQQTARTDGIAISQIYMSQSTDGGVTFPKSTLVTDDPLTSAWKVSPPSLAVAYGSTSNVVWHDSRGDSDYPNLRYPHVYYSLGSFYGNPPQNYYRVNDDTQLTFHRDPDVTLDKSNLPVIVYADMRNGMKSKGFSDIFISRVYYRGNYGCLNSIDDDKDGMKDMNDPGCQKYNDSESGDAVYECKDEIDNDQDGLTDFPDDPGCSSLTAGNESADPVFQCSDGKDNDSDGFTDYPADKQCYSSKGEESDPSSWQSVGNPGFYAGRAGSVSLAFNPENNQPYVAFKDLSAGNLNKVIVMKYNGKPWSNDNSWEVVGKPGFNQREAGLLTLAFSPRSNQPYVVYTDNVYHDRMIFMKFNGSFWEAFGNSVKIPEKDYGNVFLTDSLAIDFNPVTNEPFLAGIYKTTQSQVTFGWPFMFEQPHNIWLRVKDGPLPGTYVMKGRATRISLAVDPNTKDPYVSFNANPFAVKKYRKFIDQGGWPNYFWEDVASSYFNANFESSSLAFNPKTSEPYVALQDHRNVSTMGEATVVKYNGTIWQNVGNLRFTGNKNIDLINLDFNPLTAEPFVSFRSGGKIYVMKYDGSSWKNFGPAVGQSSDFGSGSGTEDLERHSISFNQLTNKLYVAYPDSENSNRITVKKQGGDIAPETCKLTQVSWSKAVVEAGQPVDLLIEGTRCYGKKINIIIKDEDIITDDFIANLNTVFTGDKTVITWEARYKGDFFSSPDLYFEAVEEGYPSGGISSKGMTNGILTLTKDITPPQTATDVLSGTYPVGSKITLTTSETAETYYTTDGSDPKISAARIHYTAPIELTANMSLKFYSVDPSGNEEDEKILEYAIIDPNKGDSFEYDSGLGPWRRDFYQASGMVEVNNVRPLYGNESLNIFLNDGAGAKSNGAAWIEKDIEGVPNMENDIRISFYLWSESQRDTERWKVRAYAGAADPETDGELSIIGETDQISGWKEYVYEAKVQADSTGIVRVALGISCIGTVPNPGRNYFIDMVSIDVITPEVQCNDRADNDEDNKIDMDDAGCWDMKDDDESDDVTGQPQCNNRVDDDHDGNIDMDDAGCWDSKDDDESDDVPGRPHCNNRVDDDHDGSIDMDDNGCTDLTDDDESDEPGIADVNVDGHVNIKDIQAVIRCIINPACGVPRADVNGDGKVNIKDIQAIIKAIVGNK